MGYKIDHLPQKVIDQEQNISLKFSPADLDIELITKFSINKPFSEAYQESITTEIKGNRLLKWNVLTLDDLITSKIKSGRPKDLLDIQELKRINDL